MSWIKIVLRELTGLFIDDGAFAAAIIGWVLMVWLMLRVQMLSTDYAGLAIFLGLAAILLESVRRRARK